MATPRVIASVLAYLHELYPSRDIGVATTEAWAITFADWDDVEFQACARNAASTPGRTFFPTPGEIAACRALPALDTGKILRRISALGTYNPNGWLYPSIETVRDGLGDAIATAYGAAGAERCFANDESITQDIARRTFSTELVAAQKLNPSRPLLGAPTQKLIGAS